MMFPPEQLAKVDRAELRHQLGLDAPIPVQYFKIMQRFFTGELRSLTEGRYTLDILKERLPITALFAVLAMGLALLIGIPIAVLSALKPYSWADNVAMVGSLVGMSLPSFWFGLVLIMFLSERLHLLPASGVRPLQASGYNLVQMFPYLIMPTAALSLGIVPGIVRYTRSMMVDVMAQDYIRTARSKGLSERLVIVRHALKNALIPVVSYVGVMFPYLLGGATVTETVFSLPGLGRVEVRAALLRDYPTVMTLNMFAAFIVIGCNLLADVCYGYLDPRIRQG
jgi:peptide/nickel transport system permease protein